MGPKKLSLGEKIALAASGTQEDDFPEDIEYDTSAKVVDLDEDDVLENSKPVRSSLRTKNVALLDELDERYSGLKVSRKKLAKKNGLQELSIKSKIQAVSSTEDEGIDEASESEDEEDDNDAAKMTLANDSDEENSMDDDREISDDEEDSGGSEDSDGSDSDVDESDESEEESPEMQTLSSRDQQSEIEKGKATLNQIRIWDSLLEVRIRLQKMLLDCNRLPYAESFDALVSKIKEADGGGVSTSKLLEQSQEATKVLMHELLRLQNIMADRNPEVKKTLENKATNEITPSSDPMDEEITSESDDDEDKAETEKPTPIRKRKLDAEAILRNAKKMKPEDFQASANSFFQKFLPFRNEIVQKWNDKTQFAGGKYNKKSSQQISTLRQIEQILSNRERLLRRTQVKRSNYSVIGEKASGGNTASSTKTTQEDAEAQANPEVFDDDDFYHQLLRELIERKTSNVNDPIQLSHHWLELQKLRSKLKRKVDTKASKGRKIRYDVHPKLVNYMAPQNNCSMSAAAVKELFASLFGKTKE